jgi:hypothetical protein
MSYLRSETVAVTTNSSGESTGFSANVTGKVHMIEYLPTSLSSAAAVTVKGEESSRQILTVATLSSSPGIWYPRQPTHRSTSGSTFGAEGTPVPVVNERVRFVVSGGGNGLTGTFRMILE